MGKRTEAQRNVVNCGGSLRAEVWSGDRHRGLPALLGGTAHCSLLSLPWEAFRNVTPHYHPSAQLEASALAKPLALPKTYLSCSGCLLLLSAQNTFLHATSPSA